VGFAGLDAVVRRTLAAWMVRQLQLRIDGARAAGDERETAVWLNVLGVLYLNQGMRDDAVRVLEEAVEIRKRVRGPEDANMENLAKAYSRRGEYDRAAALQEEILPCSRRVFGDEHPTTLASMNNLACSYLRLRDYSRAAALFEETLAIRFRVLGVEHIETLRAHCNLASACYLQGDYARAEPTFDEALALLRRAHGQQHPWTIYYSLRYHLLLLRTGRAVQAQPLIAANCDACASVMGLSHPRSILCVFVRALCSFYAGEMAAQGLAAALKASRDALDSGFEIDSIQREYDAAIALRGA
jgi:tetratricopeptide (TPR) repeat protein